MKTRLIAGALTFVLCALLAAILTRCVAPPPPAPAPTPTPTATPTASPTPTFTPSPTLTPTATPTASPTPTVTPSPTLTPTATPTASPTPTKTATPAPAWTPVVALRHDAMDSVRHWFPERFAPPVVAWIAVQNCNHIGRYYELLLPDGRVYLARAVDCGQFAHRAAHRERWGDQAVIELDVNAWRRWGLSLTGGWMGGIREAPRPGGCFGRGAVTEVCAGGYQVMR